MSDNILVTGRWGETHVTSAQAGNFNSGVVGAGCYVMSGLDATMTNANTCHISPGFGSFNGRDFEVPAGGIDLTIENGTQAQYRNDLVVVRYALEPSSQTESAELVVVKGAPAASDPADPAINEGSILDGDSPVDMPLWRIPIDGITVGDPVRLFQTVAPLADAQPETGEDGGWKIRKWPDGSCVMEATTTLVIEKNTAWGSGYFSVCSNVILPPGFASVDGALFQPAGEKLWMQCGIKSISTAAVKLYIATLGAVDIGDTVIAYARVFGSWK